MRLLVSTQPHWRYLVCSRAFLNAGCVRRGVRYPELEDAFVDAVDEIIEACPSPRSASMATVRRMRDIVDQLAELRKDRADLIRTASRVHSTKISPMRSLQALDVEIDALVEERSSLRLVGPSSARLLLESRLDELRRAARSFDTDRLSLNAAMRALFVSIEIDYPRSALHLTWQHGGKSTIKVNPDVMSAKDGWTATSSIPALRRIKLRRPRSRTTDV